MVLNLLHAIIICSAKSVVLISFLIKQPAVNYLHLRYYQWIRAYVTTVRSLINVDKNNAAGIDQKIGEILGHINSIDECVANSHIDLETLITGSVVEDKLEYRLPISGS